MQKIKCYINTPISETPSQEGDLIVLPGKEGELGVLYDHMPLITELNEGTIKIYNNNLVVQEIEVKSGIAYIKNDKIEIFCT